MSSRPFSRRVSLVAASALTFGTLGVLSPAPASAAVDPRPVDAGADWIAGALDGARFPGPFGFGQSIDAVIALVEAGGHESDVASVTASVAADVEDYTTYSYEFPAGELHSGESGSAVAKTLVLATRAGVSPTDFGGVDLVAELEGFTSEAPGSEGRIVGSLDGAVDDGYTNTIIQALAVQGLDAVGSPAVDRATDYLVAQQCPGGFFREGPPAPGQGSQSCVDAGTDPSVDSTAQALLGLASQADDTDVQPVIEDAVDWLLETQAADGSWGNANATGLAAWALGEAGEVAAAEKGAAWIRAHQADDFGPCTTGLTSQRGVIALDDAALAAGRAEGITDELRPSFVIATTQAVPALQWAPAGTYASEPTSNARFVRAGSVQKIHADDVAPGQVVCFALGASQSLVAAGLDGHAVGRVTMPAGTGNRTYTVGLTDGPLGTVTFRVLDGKALGATLRAKVKARGTQVLKVKGLAAQESVRVFLRGKKVVTRKAGSTGTLTVRFPVGAKTGKATVKVLGQFDDRRAVRTFTVTKGR